MTSTSLDPCLLYKRDGKKLCALFGLQIDDTTQLGDAAFFELQEKEIFLFEYNTAEIVSTEGLLLNRARIYFPDGKSTSLGLQLT